MGKRKLLTSNKRKRNRKSRDHDDTHEEEKHHSSSSSDDERQRKRSRKMKDKIKKKDKSRHKKKKNIKEEHDHHHHVGKVHENMTTGDVEPIIVGPMPLPKAEKGHEKISYGTALRPGEGDAMAQFVQKGKRIPRRGEVGISAEEIERLTGVGFVMSGERNLKMTAIRLRKENQVYTAEEKAALSRYKAEEWRKREDDHMACLRKIIDRAMASNIA